MSPESDAVLRAQAPPAARSSSLLLVRWLPAVPAALYALIVYPFIYRDVVGEPDLERVALALLYGTTTGLREAAGFHYDLRVSFGYYAALYHLLPRAVLLDPARLIAAMNHIGYACAVATVAFLALYAGRVFGRRAAFAACMLFGLSPVFLDLGTSGHPQLPAMALWLLGAWLLTFICDTRVGRWGRVAAGAAAFVVTVAALTVRIDVALAFPFVTVAGPREEISSARTWLRAGAIRLAVLAGALALFMAVQLRWYAGSGGNAGFVKAFFAEFYKLGMLPKGLVVFTLATGIASLACAAVMVCVPSARRVQPLHGLAIVFLAAPSLAFWLPNPTPARHMLFATLAVALFIALALAAWARPGQLIALAVLLPLANQACAEATHGLIVRHYDWAYPKLVARRATDSVPVGAFPLDHAAKQQAYRLLREEGRAFARACRGHVLVFADEPRYMMLSLLGADPGVRLSRLQEGPFRITQAAGRRCTADFVAKAATPHEDVMGRFLASGRDASWPIYFQEARRTVYDRTPVPAGRRFCIDLPAQLPAQQGCAPGA
jgi:hypothetical protein